MLNILQCCHDGSGCPLHEGTCQLARSCTLNVAEARCKIVFHTGPPQQVPMDLQDSGIAEAGSEFVDLTCTDPTSFKRWTVSALCENIAMVRDATARVADGAMTRSRLENITKVVGFRWNEHGMWADASFLSHVDPLAAITVDWVHNTLQDGTFTTEVCDVGQCGPGADKCRSGRPLHGCTPLEA